MALDEEPEPIRSTDPTSGESSFGHRIREGQPKPLEGSSVAFFRRAEHERPEPAPGLVPGRVVGDFRLVALIGQGGMGQVWEAEQLSLRRSVAMKFVLPERVTEHQLTLFAREARAGGRLHHPGIVTVHGYGHSDGLSWIAMELVEGAWTLKDFLDETTRASEVPEGYDRGVARFVAEIADAMQAAHEAGVIHRDLKPQNVLITAEDHPKVTDFGLARITDETALSATGDVAGTYFYMSPEQVVARRAGLDHRTDVFSLGIVLYELLALRRPFEGDTSHQVAAKILAADPTDLRTIRSRIPRDLAVIAAKALEKERDKRFQTMQELAADLRRYLANEPIHARPPTPVERIVKWTKRNPAKSVAAGTAAVTFTAIALLLAANIRTNRALSAKSNESEGRRVAAEKSAQREKEAADLAKQNERRALAGEQQARDEKDRADREADAAVAARDDVLRLSALQRLDDLTAEGARLWPAHPENIRRYEDWLARAELLVSELPGHEEKLAELRTRARPWTAQEHAEFRARHPRARHGERLERELAFLRTRSAVLAGGEPGPEPTAADVGLDLAALPANANELTSLAWPLVEPGRKEFGGERKGLALARRAMELAADAERADIRSRLAWALFALGRFDDAMAEEERALAEAASGRRAELEGDLTKLRGAIEAELEPEAADAAENRARTLEEELAAIEAELSTRTDWTFDDDQDKWWHNQLVKLVNGVRAFADEKTGLFSEGVSPEHGWGMKKRLASALAQQDGFGPEGEHTKAWAAALAALRAAYPGLALRPQLGLVPVGPDPDSGLWEFVHLETGEPQVRGPDGKLVVTEQTGLVFVLLRGGEFLMGAQKSDPNGANYDPGATPPEEPVHPVTLSPFFLSKYEMTQAQWVRLTSENPSFYKPGALVRSLAHPVEQVSWTECMEVMSRHGLCLPSEAQWEYAARGGTSSAWWTGNERGSVRGAGNLADQAAARAGAPWLDIEDWPDLDDGYAIHAPVDALRKNPFGLHNVIGNVWEWCLDGFGDSQYEPRGGKDPVCPPEDFPFRLNRGGCFGFAAKNARSASRGDAYTPSAASGTIGLRPARILEP